MTDTMQDQNREENFWEDVDALRAMLDAEDSEMELPDPMEDFSSVSFREEKAAAPRREPRRQAPPKRPAAPYPAPGQHRVASRPQKPAIQKAAGSHGARGLIITLYVIIAAELAGILAVGAQWYLWMK